MKLNISIMGYLCAICISNVISHVNCMQQEPAEEKTDSVITNRERSRLIALKLEKEHFKDYSDNSVARGVLGYNASIPYASVMLGKCTSFMNKGSVHQIHADLKSLTSLKTLKMGILLEINTLTTDNCLLSSVEFCSAVVDTDKEVMLQKDTDAYNRWPELKAAMEYKNQICRNFYEDLNTFENVGKVTASVYQIFLHYPLHSYHAVSIRGLRCHVPPKIMPSQFRNIILSRSPHLKCLLVLVPYKPKYLGPSGPFNYQIIGELCDQENQPESTCTTNENTNKQENFGHYWKGFTNSKVKTNRNVKEEVDLAEFKENKQKQKEVNQEIPWEMDNRIPNLTKFNKEQDDRTEQEKKRVRFTTEFFRQ